MCEVLRDYRERAGISQAELGAGIGLHQTSIGKIELGQRRLDIVELFKICDYLGADPVDFVRDMHQRLKDAEHLPPPH